MLQKENQNWRKVLTKFFVPNVIDRIKIKLIERCHFKVNQWLYTDRWSHKVCWQNKNYLLEKGNKWIRTSCAFNIGTTRKREKTQLGPLFIYFADCAYLSNLVIYADSSIRWNSRNKIKMLFKLWLTSRFTRTSLCYYSERKIVAFNFYLKFQVLTNNGIL